MMNPRIELIRSTHTLGCFQIESPGQRELWARWLRREFNDLIIDISLFRPGPMKSDMVRPFLEHRHGFAPEVYPHPDLKPVLQETHGVTVFHEQILKTFDVMTQLRAGQGRRIPPRPGQRGHRNRRWRSSSAERPGQNGYTPEVVDKVWGTLKAFGSFGFCKAHGAAFAVPTYQSAWLKAHHPEAFLAGLWEHDPGMYPKRLLVAEARRLGIPILPLDINRSGAEYRVERVAEGPDRGKLGIRLSLNGIFGLSGAELKRIVAGQPYDSLADLRARSRLSKPSIKRLAQLGAFDSLHRESGGAANRADLVQHLQNLQGRQVRKGLDVIDGQLALPLGDVELRNVKAELPAPTMVENVRAELDLMAVDVSEHLMSSHRPLLDRLGVTTADKLLGLRNGTEVLVAGVRIATQTPPMRGGRRVVFISIDDGTGCVDSVFFHEAQEHAGPLLFGTRLLLIRGTTRRTGPRGISLSASMAWDLSRIDTLPFPEQATVPAQDGAQAKARPVCTPERSSPMNSGCRDRWRESAGTWPSPGWAADAPARPIRSEPRRAAPRLPVRRFGWPLP